MLCIWTRWIFWISFGITGWIANFVVSNVFYNVTCSSNTMLVMMNVSWKKSWPLVYLQNLKGYPGCEPETMPNVLVFHLNLNETSRCGINKMLNKQTGHSVFYHRIVIEVPDQNKEYLFIQCVIPGDFNMDFVRLDWQKESLPVQNFTTSEEVKGYLSKSSPMPTTVPYLQMSIRDKGTRLDTSTLVKPGSALDLLIYMEKNMADHFGLSLRYLTLIDGTRSQEEIIVMNGCSVDPYVIQVFHTEEGVIKSQFRAFKFQSSEFVIFLATVNVCQHKCVEVECYGSVDSSGRRQREIPQYLPHYKNELYEVEVVAFLRLRSGVKGDIIREDSTNETLDTLYDTEGAIDYPSDVELSKTTGMTTDLRIYALCWLITLVITTS